MIWEVIKWTVVILLILFFGSAIIAGIWDGIRGKGDDEVR